MSDMASGISALLNPRRVLKKREEQAGLGMNLPEGDKPAAPAEKPAMSQADFLYGRKREETAAAPAASASKQGGPAASEDKPKPRRTLRDMLRRRGEQQSAADAEFKTAWNGEDEPLSSAARAGMRGA